MSNAITPVDSTPAASATRPQVKLPVDALIQPMMSGPAAPSVVANTEATGVCDRKALAANPQNPANEAIAK